LARETKGAVALTHVDGPEFERCRRAVLDNCREGQGLADIAHRVIHHIVYRCSTRLPTHLVPSFPDYMALSDVASSMYPALARGGLTHYPRGWAEWRWWMCGVSKTNGWRENSTPPLASTGTGTLREAQRMILPPPPLGVARRSRFAGCYAWRRHGRAVQVNPGLTLGWPRFAKADEAKTR